MLCDQILSQWFLLWLQNSLTTWSHVLRHWLSKCSKCFNISPWLKFIISSTRASAYNNLLYNFSGSTISHHFYVNRFHIFGTLYLHLILASSPLSHSKDNLSISFDLIPSFILIQTIHALKLIIYIVCLCSKCSIHFTLYKFQLHNHSTSQVASTSY